MEEARAAEVRWCAGLSGSSSERLAAMLARIDEVVLAVTSRDPIGVTAVEAARYAVLVGEAERLHGVVRAVAEEELKVAERRAALARLVVSRRARGRRLARAAVRSVR